jgi:hypothetical protein
MTVMFNFYIFLMTLLIYLPQTFAGVFELSASANYRRSQINELNYQDSQSITASVSYYFLEMSAIELSYTQGTSTLRAQGNPSDLWVEYVNEFTLYGADLVLTFASQESLFQPFVKIGAAHIVKDLIINSETGSTTRTPSDPETVPSAGIGFKIKLSKTFSIKVGIDGWLTNQDDSEAKIDYAGRAGVSWLL